MLVLVDSDVTMDAHLAPVTPRGTWMTQLPSAQCTTLLVPGVRRQVFVRTSHNKTSEALALLAQHAPAPAPAQQLQTFLSGAPTAPWAATHPTWMRCVVPHVVTEFASSGTAPAQFAAWLATAETTLVAKVQGAMRAALSGGNVHESLGFVGSLDIKAKKAQGHFAPFFAGRSASGMPDTTDLPIFGQMVAVSTTTKQPIAIVTGDNRFYNNIRSALASGAAQLWSLNHVTPYCFASLAQPPAPGSLPKWNGTLSPEARPKAI